MGVAGGGGRPRRAPRSSSRQTCRRISPGSAKRRAQVGKRDPEGRERLFPAGARPGSAMVTRCVEERRGTFGVEPVCRVLGLPTSTYYARRSREPPCREPRDRQLVAEIHVPGRATGAPYGVRKTWKKLSRQGVEVGRDRVARLMRAESEGCRTSWPALKRQPLARGATPVGEAQTSARCRGNNGNARRSLGFAEDFPRETDSAQRCGLGEPERSGANGRPDSTSWGPLVRVQYRPSKTPAKPGSASSD